MTAITQRTMTDEQRKSVALEYLKRLDRGGDIFALFADDAQVSFPKWGLANGLTEIGEMSTALGGVVGRITHDYASINWIISGDVVVAEGTSHGASADGTEFRAGLTHGGRWCDVFEIRDDKIQRCFVYLDPYYAGADTELYPWLATRSHTGDRAPVAA